MKKSRWDKHKLGHYRPIEDCRIPKQTFMIVCLECNRCGRFTPVVRREKVKKKFAIDYRWTGKQFFSFFPRKWRRWQSYTTEKQRDQALRTLQKKGYYGMTFYEFRKAKK